MSALVVDTSIWIDFFRGNPLPALERALKDGNVVLPVAVVAELTSAPVSNDERSRLESFLTDLPLHGNGPEHWLRVGKMRAVSARSGLTVSVVDAHVAQTAVDLEGAVWSRDAIFEKMAVKSLLRLFRP